ncbi:MAG: hypothetical protein CBB87_09345 [Micavibrio sp. TMED27]|nr:hypothetical protein [Micavibrio sp.]OUT90343.1 MAG: hypothetical protein CBB87_09345 [Micavibrio sp. TMED27]|tara:strand:+ start:2315 stop:2791 length:477 start_codon:yes stop_codon:yes gene_type:complete
MAKTLNDEILNDMRDLNSSLSTYLWQANRVKVLKGLFMFSVHRPRAIEKAHSICRKADIEFSPRLDETLKNIVSFCKSSGDIALNDMARYLNTKSNDILRIERELAKQHPPSMPQKYSDLFNVNALIKSYKLHREMWPPPESVRKEALKGAEELSRKL